ncbi:S8 family serine peptidase [Haloechinothrix salitolerans]|uniref:S8 family serine peptidase n=1 Tax=Haloechinothrix salitolerans TaxID=926830 RepID=A0ABW2C394_9PSEU
MTDRSRWRRKLAVAAAAALALPMMGVSSASAQESDSPLAPVSDSLSGLLGTLAGGSQVTALVHGSDLAAAEAAIAKVGMDRVTSFDRIAVVAATGTVDQVREVRGAEGVTYVENNDPIELFASSGTVATRSAEARLSRTSPTGEALDGSGSSVAIIDTGVDPNHPAFAAEDGSSRVVRNLKSLCTSDQDTGCIIDAGPLDTDTLSVGGHGTHVTGIAAGAPYSLSGIDVGGSAPGAKIVSISTGAGLVILGANAALDWILENHEAPCGADVSAEECPPIKVINNSYGPSGGGEFDPDSATVKLQRALAAEGVVTVWANGNDGGDGSQSLSNPPGQDPTPGVISVASYFDEGTGTRDGKVSDFSSRGLAEDSSTWPDISAPGEAIVSACRPYLLICSTGGEPYSGPGLLDLATYNVISGTSMAAPQITGIVAQLYQAKPDATPAEIEDALKATAHKYTDGAAYEPLEDYTSSFDKGTGLVDVVAAVDHLTATS